MTPPCLVLGLDVWTSLLQVARTPGRGAGEPGGAQWGFLRSSLGESSPHTQVPAGSYQEVPTPISPTPTRGLLRPTLGPFAF